VNAHDNRRVGILLNSSAANTTVTSCTFSGNGSGRAGTGLSATHENWPGSMSSGDGASILQPNGTRGNYHHFEPGDPQFGGQPYKSGGTYGLIHTRNTGE
jgi:parallel beta-helix repeat protein